MTAADNVIAFIDPGAIAWDLISKPGALPGQTTVRAAIRWAAAQTAHDPSWIEDDVRFDTLRGVVNIWAVPDLERRFDKLVAATLAQFGPMIDKALGDLVPPVVSR